MKVPFEWLSEFVVIDMDPQDLAVKLTMCGLEVEGMEKLEPSFDGVVVGKIIGIDKHPDAENLVLCMVDAGMETLPIVCGAKNTAVGDKVPLATVGARLKDGFVVEKKKIRGIESLGMLCSERELGLSDDHSGIFILPDKCRVGHWLHEEDFVWDVILDINIPPNRGDCLSMYGIAREVGSILNQRAKLPIFNLTTDKKRKVKDYLSLEVRNTDACPRYVLRLINGISIRTSPFWMRNRIIKCGMRPINTIVDVTNYVMLELGQPLHAFDYHKIRGQKIEVRLADQNTVFRTLDSEERKLLQGDILICDGEGPVALAGIMGGENSEISGTTEDVALESAYFNPLYIRKTTRRLGIKSEASLRFEKGIDVDNVGFAAERAVFLMNMLSGGTVIKGEREVHEKKELKTLFITYSDINGLLGTHISQRDITKILRSIDLHIKKEDEGGLLITIPNFRHDIAEPADIVEEISRLYGYNRIPATRPVSPLSAHKLSAREIALNTAKEFFKGAGFFELINFAFFSEKDVEYFLISPPDERTAFVNIMNPISREYAVMRTFITPGVLKSIAYNINRGAKNLRFFEKGKAFFLSKDGNPHERFVLCFAMTGREVEFFWRDQYSDYDFFDIKGIMEGLMGAFGVTFSLQKTAEPFLNPQRAADIFADGTKAGWIGELREEVSKSYGIEQSIYCAELQFDIILEKVKLEVQYHSIPRFPQVTRDFSFFIDDSIPVEMVINRIREASPLIMSVGVFDMFKKEKRSVSFRVIFQSYEDTLKDEAVNRLQEIIIKELTNIDGISLRA
ncbi:MAG: phenylalanine--tRNA ligase subunit beta [Syntrophorhabdaceae bacterium]|nr:phenylalanine--tRNA ligase subunit beta [Syntrophorhabdaceae bacterium]